MRSNYVWDKKKIKDKLFELTEKSKCNNLSTHERNIIDISLCSYDELFRALTNAKKDTSIYNINDFLSFYDDMFCIRRTLLMSENVINIISYFAEMPLIPNKPSKKIGAILTDHNIINTSKEFYYKLDIDLHDIITDAENKNDTIYHFTTMKKDNSNIGETFYDLYNNLAYIYIGKDNTVNEYFSLIHEYGHILDYSSQFKRCSSIRSMTTEITSQLMEMLFAQSYNEDNSFKIETHKIMQRNFNGIIKTSKILKLQLKLFNIMKEMDIYDIESYYKVYSQFSSNELKLILDDDQYKYNIAYVFSYVIASILFYHYQDNKKDTLFKIKYMISNGFSMNPLDLFDDIGIDLYDIGSNIKRTKVFIPEKNTSIKC